MADFEQYLVEAFLRLSRQLFVMRYIQLLPQRIDTG